MKLLVLLLATMTLWAQDPLQLGARAMREGHFDEAERIYRQLLKDSPDDPRLHLNLGLSLHSAKKYREALPELRRYLKANPEPGAIHLLLGVAQLKLKQPCDAISALESARKWKATAEVLVELGDAYSGCKRWPNAARTYHALAKMQPAEKYAWAAARAYWQAREYAQAKPLYADLEAALESNPRFQFEYGDTLARSEGAEAGLPYLEKAARAEPSLMAARGALGRALLELKRAAEAVPHLEVAARDDPTLLLPLSRAYRATGRVEDAVRTEAEYRQKAVDQN
jgi:predicted Zn-dependent protease